MPDDEASDKSPADAPPARSSTPLLQTAEIFNAGAKYSFEPFPSGSRNELLDYLEGVGPADKELFVVDLLQRSWDTELNAAALQLVLNSLVEALPLPIRLRVDIRIGDPSPEDVDPVTGKSEWFSQTDPEFEDSVAEIENAAIPSLRPGNKEFVIWVVRARASETRYYVTVVLHYAASDPARPGVLDRITDWSVVDPLSSPRYYNPTNVVRRRMLGLLRHQGIRDARVHDTWVPPCLAGEDTTSGLAVYAVVSQLLDRIGAMHCHGQAFDAPWLFAPTRPWFDPDSLRAEALGRAAFKAMEKLEWRARVALFPIKPVADDECEKELKRGVYPPAGHTPLPRSRDGSVKPEPAGEADWLSSVYNRRDAATQTPEREPSPAPSSDAQSSSSGSSDSSSGSSDSSPLFSSSSVRDYFLHIYTERKREDLERFREDINLTSQAVTEAESFAGRVHTEVLDNERVVSAAILRAFGLYSSLRSDSAQNVDQSLTLLTIEHRAQEQCADLEASIERLATTYVPMVLHDITMDRLDFRKVVEEAIGESEGFSETMNRVKNTLHLAYESRAALGDAAHQLVEAGAPAREGDWNATTAGAVDKEKEEETGTKQPPPKKKGAKKGKQTNKGKPAPKAKPAKARRAESEEGSGDGDGGGGGSDDEYKDDGGKGADPEPSSPPDKKATRSTKRKLSDKTTPDQDQDGQQPVASKKARTQETVKSAEADE
ncbi:hypothetical protein F4802DRAFT_620245 [Xylaria palmicola]|nr:hypothetical protein F4802DRAFT_620245 [Xylaria palmicola]